MLTDAQQLERRDAIVRILRDGLVRKQADLVRLLQEGRATRSRSPPSAATCATSACSRPAAAMCCRRMRSRAPTAISARWRSSCASLRSAGPSITVVRTTIGAAQSVAVAIDKAEWPEVVGTISGDDTIFIATADQRAQARTHRAPAHALSGLNHAMPQLLRAPSPSCSPIPAASTPPSWCPGSPRTSAAPSSR